ncbi:protein-disulfide reductase DsbD [Colwellia sp. MB02u-18]|uniref:protein-disulfide reductase DsbD n=1 Tax=unclassified Colwellia TaxID=196834 RepID=UPI0015F39655|nr:MULTISPECIES: protein-disulfide reductase DsbD [unclassified Colwellia]MBA6224653.1 protein-disulfide reductase DsbD [Colwellia sp. MB3u-45]MBA6268035.1 protein-disulfide reductase DsbD [Colwellia sp. MB3u-43]MBA6322487.1 protein-disulfide reductase DsbD [Colwellia sp. MB02u-19]MBA6326065.1 protein-disulfide reductase DsbD [Colwellia sp. MB02u-18]MBA6331524.1 protein-disulfide reductase DsbD [Colwellia sp. MB02u-12]
MKKIVTVFWLILTSLCFATTPLANAQESIFNTPASLFSNDNEFLKVDDAFIFDFHQQKNQLKVSFNIADGYYLYRHQFKFTSENATIVPVNLPQGERYEDEFFGVQQIFTGQLDFTIDITQAQSNANVTIRYQGCAKKGLCYPPTKQTIEVNEVKQIAAPANDAKNILSALGSNSEDEINTQSASSTSNSNSQSNQIQRNNANSSEQHQLADMLKSDSVWLTLAAFFVGGLLLSFTPCVFPMYPILTGIIVGQGEKLSTKRAFALSFAYVQGMAVTYTLLGIVVAIAGAQFQAMFQHPVVLIALSLLFIFLALSMFGTFNLALPSSWQNKLNQLSSNQKGGSYFGVLVMGAISGLVASPCTTAPLTGALLYISQSGDILLGASALYALSLGMGLPLLVLGSSGGKLLPKAGNWMNVIKNIFGLLLLAVPIFLLERFLPLIVIDILWVLLILATAGYFYTVNQASAKTFGFGLRSILIFLVFFIGANKAYQLVYPVTNNVLVSAQTELRGFEHVKNLTEMNQAIATANAQGKTVMVDLYADWCVACKEFEEYTFFEAKVQKALADTVLLQIDLTDTGSKDSVELMSKFEIFGLPSILFFDLTGNELSQRRVTGFMEADEFSAHVDKTFTP